MHTPAADGPAGRAAEPPFALSVDVEEHFQVQAFAHRVARREWSRYPSRVARNTERLLDLFDAAGARGTFFVLGWVAREHRPLVSRIASRGHEIASHGMSHRMLGELTRDAFREEARESKALLEDLAGTPVLGFRAPSYSVGVGTLWALPILAETGYAYDSSIYPIRRRRYGYPAGPTRPERLQTGTGASIVEFPLPTVPLGPIRFPVLAGAYLRLLPGWVSVAAARWHALRRVPLVLNVHPWEIDPDQPTIGSSRLATWTHYARLGRTMEILSAVLRCGRFAPVATRLAELRLLDDGARTRTAVS
jgi:polysaccharide deacetylase family protein (PEP-CTERM system associated)